MKFIKSILLATFVALFGFAGLSHADPNHCDVNDQVKWEKHIKECGPFPTTTTVAETTTTTTVVDRVLPNTGSTQDTTIIVAAIAIATGVIVILVVRKK